MTVEQIFLKVLNIGISAGWLILTVVALRLLLRRAPKWVPCLLWGIVAVRLICPFSIESAWSLVPNGNTVDTGRVYFGTIAIDSGVSMVNKVVNWAALRLLEPVGDGSGDTDVPVNMEQIAGERSGQGLGQGLEQGLGQGLEQGLGQGLDPELEPGSWLESGTKDAAVAGNISAAGDVDENTSSANGLAERLNSSVARGYMVRQKLLATITNPEANEDLAGGLYLLVDVEPALIFIGILSRIWLIGIAGMVAYAVISFLVLRWKVAAAVPMEGCGDVHGQAQVLLCDAIGSPFILGLFKPRIYLPSSIEGQDATFVLAHERAHLRRGDNWWKAVGFVLLAVYWFHPLVWLAYVLLGKDIELACDESVVSGFDMADRKAYASTLLSCSMHRKMVFTYPLAFGEVGVKERVKAVLNNKKPTFWIVAGAVVICAAVAVCFLTNPKQDGDIDGRGNVDNSENVGGNNGESITDGIAEGDEIPDGPALPGADNIYPKIMVNENVYEWRRGRAVEDTLPEGCVYYGELVHVDGETPENDCAFVSEFAATGKIYTMPENSAVVYIRIKTDWMEDKVVLFDLISGQGEENLLQRPVINLADNVGADSIELLYADKERIIFSGYFGLFAYSKELRCIIRSVDLKAIGCHYTQGDNYCEKWVSADGDTVYLHPMSMKQMYIYHRLSES